MKKTKPNPFEVARTAIEEAYGDHIGELHYTIQNELKGNALNKLYCAINPKHDELQKRHDELFDRTMDGGDDKLISEFDDVWSSRAIIMQDAAFVLGIAFALRMKGDRP